MNRSARSTSRSPRSEPDAFVLPQDWYVFGPVEREHRLCAQDMTCLPQAISTSGGPLPSQHAVATEGRLDLAPHLGGTVDGRHAYVFIPFTLAAARDLAFGFGADWRFAAWVDGRLIADRLEEGNCCWPPSPWDHTGSARLAKGPHILVIRFVSGAKASALCAAAADGGEKLLRASLLPQLPYPRSRAIKGIRWLADPAYSNWNGDVWSCTWAKDGDLYTVGDDTKGGGAAARNLAIDRVEGGPLNAKIIRVNPMDEWGAAGQHGWWKGAGLASIDGVLYLGIYSQSRPRPGGATKLSFCAFNSAIMKSHDYGQTWTPRPNDGPALFPLFPGREFPTPYFVQYGQDYQDAVDEYVYLISNDGGWNNWNCMKLARVPRERFAKLDVRDWEFFLRCGRGDQPVWTPSVQRAGAVFQHPGYTSMTGVQYVPAVRRYILGQWAYISVKGRFDRTELCPEPWPWGTDHLKYHLRTQSMLALYESPHPWGPWRCFHCQDNWGPSFYCPNFPAKWFEDGGRKMWIVEGGNYFTDAGRGYEFTVQPLQLLL